MWTKIKIYLVKVSIFRYICCLKYYNDPKMTKEFEKYVKASKKMKNDFDFKNFIKNSTTVKKIKKIENEKKEKLRSFRTSRLD